MARLTPESPLARAGAVVPSSRILASAIRAVAPNSALQRTRLLPGSQQCYVIMNVMPRSSYCSRAAERER
jgi:hypothetical protein